jgi:hypothetical protein
MWVEGLLILGDDSVAEVLLVRVKEIFEVIVFGN